MAQIPKSVSGEGGTNTPKVLAALRTLFDDVDAIRTTLDNLVTKLNADATAQNAAVTNSQLDTDYAAPAALTTTKE